MKIKYQFVNDESREIEVTEELAAILIEMDQDIAKSDRRETRRHISLDGMAYEGDIFADTNTDIAAQFEAAEEETALHKAIQTLLPQQKELLRKVFFDRRTIVSIAAEEGVWEGAIRDRLRKIYARLKKVL